MDSLGRNDTDYEKFVMENVDTQVDFQRRRQTSRCAVVCLGLLCAVLLAGNIGQIVNYEMNNRPKLAERLQNDAGSTKKEQLQSNCTTIQRQNQQLHLQNDALTIEKEQLQRNCTAIQRQNEQLLTGRNQLQKLVNDMEVKIRGMYCKTGWRKFGTNCYFASSIKTNWTEGRKACIAEGADLVIFNSRDEQAFVNGLLSADQHAWIGLTDSHNEGEWKWVDGTPVATTCWGPGQPNSYKGTDQDCGEITQDSSVGLWNDETCSLENISICEK